MAKKLDPAQRAAENKRLADWKRMQRATNSGYVKRIARQQKAYRKLVKADANRSAAQRAQRLANRRKYLEEYRRTFKEPVVKMSARERRKAALVMQREGMTYAQIAGKLGLRSPKYVAEVLRMAKDGR
jgi:hypothetical protein